MNKNSFLCNFINENQNDYEEKLSSKPYFIVIKKDGPLAIFNYNMMAEEIIYFDKSVLDENGIARVARWFKGEPIGIDNEWYFKASPIAPDGNIYALGATVDDERNVIGNKMEAMIYRCDFTLPEVQEARGIILNIETLEVVCWPFRKFGNYGESYIDTIDWSTARTQEKVDGSIMKLWWNDLNDNWQVSTNAVIYPEKLSLVSGDSFDELFNEAAVENNLDYSILNKDYTYIFELVGPLNRVVIKYDKCDIYHIGTRNKITGEELNVDINIHKPKEYPLNSLDACIEAAKALGGSEDDDFDVEDEGYVVVDANWHRIKIKNPYYVMAHHSLNGGMLSRKRILSLIVANEYEEYLTYFPQYKSIFTEYLKKIEILKAEISEVILVATEIATRMNGAPRKEIVGELIKTLGNRKSWGFQAVFYGDGVKEIFEKMTLESLKKEFEKISI